MSLGRAGALQAAIGNAAVARAVQRERHTHDADCGHGQDAAPRSLVPDVLRRPGRPLAEPLRREMEDRLGADFSDVRVHTGATAQRSAAEIGARAYTAGSNVVIGPGGADKHTLAHELTHVIQQRSGPVSGTDNGAGLALSDPSDAFERAAEANARRVMSGPPVQRAPVRRESATAEPGLPGRAGDGAPVQRMLGFETEVSLPVQDSAGHNYPGDTDLAQSTREDFKVVSDKRLLGAGRKGTYSNIEFVTGAVEVVGPQSESGRERLVRLVDEIRRVREGFYAAADRTPLAGMALDLQILREGADARVAPGVGYPEEAGSPGNGDGLFVHYSVGVPLRGMPLFFDHLRQAAPDVPGAPSRRARFRLAQAEDFAADIVKLYEENKAQYASKKRKREVETDELNGYAQLFFMQIAAVADYLAEDRDSGQIKNLTAVLSRSRLSDVRALLAEEFRAFLTGTAEKVVDVLAGYQEKPGQGDRELEFREQATREIDGNPVSLIDFARSAIHGETRVDQQSVFGGMNQIAPHKEAGSTMVPFEIRTMGSNKKTWDELKTELDSLAQWAEEAYQHDRGQSNPSNRARGGSGGGSGGA
ncbi:eCIS core domain-containing protein [Streptomyces vietnamensis]|uniref:eCIS core domain-containing protein n=1 Tax=Streptomyces vietnamensis TaxID=362257 RepID=UPI00342F8E7D